MSLGSTQPLTNEYQEYPGGKGWAACDTDNLTAIC
jgi:hypothetical protein